MSRRKWKPDKWRYTRPYLKLAWLKSEQAIAEQEAQTKEEQIYFECIRSQNLQDQLYYYL
jgi:hypothetical protein